MNIFKQFQSTLQSIHNALIAYDQIMLQPDFDFDDFVENDLIESRDQLDENSIMAFINYRDNIIDDRHEYGIDDFKSTYNLTETESMILYWLLHHELPDNRYMKKPQQPKLVCGTCDEPLVSGQTDLCKQCDAEYIPETCNVCHEKTNRLDCGVCPDCCDGFSGMMDDEINDTKIDDLSDVDLTTIMIRSGYDEKIIHHDIIDRIITHHIPWTNDSPTKYQYKIVCIFDKTEPTTGYHLHGAIFVEMIDDAWVIIFG